MAQMVTVGSSLTYADLYIHEVNKSTVQKNVPTGKALDIISQVLGK